ncbi:hypothetical protein BY996DRAFT_6415349 [Phakopsora pachyrhizi]|nr:hypothetical protein BY996DRAFT_6415349 [Phakopsora pachyrhizi]
MSLLMCPAMIFPVIINEQTLVNKNSSQPDDHLLTPENLIKPLVVSQQPLLTRLSKDYKSQTDCSSSSSPISNVGNEIGVSNYHPASDDLASSQYKFWNDYDQADLDTFDEIEAQYALQLTQSNSHPSCIQPCPTVSFVFQTGAGNPIKMDENLEEPHIATQYQYWGGDPTKGYTGEAILSKVEPINVIYGLPTAKDQSLTRGS